MPKTETNKVASIFFEHAIRVNFVAIIVILDSSILKFIDIRKVCSLKEGEFRCRTAK